MGLGWERIDMRFSNGFPSSRQESPWAQGTSHHNPSMLHGLIPALDTSQDFNKHLLD